MGLIDLDRLEALAKAATPGPWHIKRGYCLYDSRDMHVVSAWENYSGSLGLAIYPDEAMANAKFLESVNPAVVLELIAMCRCLHWTTTKPTQDGAYWYRRHAGEKLLAHVDDEMVTLLDMPGQEHVSFFDGEWAGPIPEPQEPVS